MSTTLSQAQLAVDQLKAQAAMERAKVSEASQRYVHSLYPGPHILLLPLPFTSQYTT